MPKLIPFNGIVPKKNKVEKVVSKPYDKYTFKEIKEIVTSNEDSFLHIIQPELATGKKNSLITTENLKKSRAKFELFLSSGIIEKKVDKGFYIYRQIKPTFTYTGIIANISAKDYRNGTIKIHEQTLAQKEEKLKDYLKIVGINAEPVMFTYPHQAFIDNLVNRLVENEKYADFEKDGIQHQLWLVEEKQDVDAISTAFEKIEKVYVADGHHRSASSVLLAEELNENGNGPWSNFMGIFFPDHNLQLFEFNRLLKDKNGLTTKEIINALSEDFLIEHISSKTYKPNVLHEISMYTEGNWYSLKLKHDRKNEQLTDKLDANILSKNILSSIFGVHDLRNDSRIDFVSGMFGPEALKEKVDAGEAAIAFGLFPVSYEQFFAFSDQGKIMPPKTTWFEPKLLNGLVMYDLEIG
jgi:uncharacterized protein (DUF1015 family)